MFSIIETTYKRVRTKMNNCAERRLEEKQETKISDLIAAFVVVLPLAAFTYWRIFFEKFGENYFECCYHFDDVYYILYSKGTTVWFVSLLLSWALLLPSVITRFKKPVLLLGISSFICLVISFVTNGSHFLWYQTLIFVGLSIVIFVCYNFLSRLALYGYIALLGFFFVTSAYIDSAKFKESSIKKEILRKNGSTFLSKDDKDKFFIGSTSKFLLVYDKHHGKVNKIEKDSIL
jgi:hypothetical protein